RSDARRRFGPLLTSTDGALVYNGRRSSAKKGGRRQLGGRRVPRCKSTGLDFAGSGSARRRRRTQPDKIQAFLIAIFFSLFCACTVLGSVTVSTPFLKFASILSVSTPSGTPPRRRGRVAGGRRRADACK